MKISLIGPVTPYRGGIAHFTTLLAKQLIDAGHNVQVISFKKQYPKWLYPGESDKDFSPGREKVDAEHLLNPLNPFTWSKTVLAIKTFQPDEVILPWWVTFWGPAFRNVSKRLKDKGFQITYLIHNTIPHEARAFDKWLARRTLAQADRFIVMTHKEKKRLLELLPSAEHIDVVSLPIFHPFPSSGLTQEETRQKLALPEGVPILLFFGFVRPYKGLNVLIESLHILHEMDLPAHLLVVGEFWNDNQCYLTQIDGLGLSEFVHIEDRYVPDDEVAIYFETANIYVAPYVDGTQSASLKSALGCGLPAVVTEAAADPLARTLTEQCKIVPVNDAYSLAQGIADQVGQPRLDTSQINELIRDSWMEIVNVIEKNPESQPPMPGKEISIQ